MRITVSFVLRVGGSDSFAPVEKAVVLKEGERAMHRDGGYYVFVSPMKMEEKITVSAYGYQPFDFIWNGESSAAVYLESKNIPPREITLLFAAKYAKGAENLSVVSPVGTLPQMLEGCTIRYGKHSSVISQWNRAEGTITLPPISESIAQGQSLTVSAKTK
ncbi:MAG: hypothetical protein ACI4J1_02815 [Ruminiclostridium sp.]